MREALVDKAVRQNPPATGMEPPRALRAAVQKHLPTTEEAMYYATVTLLMFMLPLVSIGVEWASGPDAVVAALLLKWYVFWAVGCRLFLAGMRQIVQPTYTARKIFGHQGDESVVLVRELGFANVSIGAIGLASLLLPSWRMPAALAGGTFYLLAGGNHLRQRHRNRLENVAMVSDLFAGVVLVFSLLADALVYSVSLQ